jgi:hypothetical protein
MTITACKDDKPSDFSGIEQSLKELVSAQISLGKEVLRLLGEGADAGMSGLRGLQLPKLKSCCSVPEACWMPRALGELTLRLAANGKGEIRFEVTNSDYRSRSFSVTGAGNNASLVNVSPKQATLAPMERAVFTATVAAPAQPGTYQFLVAVHGCSDHYLRGVLHVGGNPKTSCYVVTVDDRPDYFVHWYDHFYCRKPCFGSTVKTPG